MHELTVVVVIAHTADCHCAHPLTRELRAVLHHNGMHHGASHLHLPGWVYCQVVFATYVRAAQLVRMKAKITVKNAV